MYNIKKSSKYWIWGAIAILFINLLFFIFRNYLPETALIWVVILTPVACLVLFPLTRILDKNEVSQPEKGF